MTAIRTPVLYRLLLCPICRACSLDKTSRRYDRNLSEHNILVIVSVERHVLISVFAREHYFKDKRVWHRSLDLYYRFQFCLLLLSISVPLQKILHCKFRNKR
jgi:hypothetical protein